MNEVIKFSDWLNFQPKQRLATQEADAHQYALYGGAGGGGKSYWLRKYLVRRLIKLHKITGLTNIVAGLFCEDYPALKDRHLSRIALEFPEWLGTQHADHKSYGNCFLLHKEWGSGVMVFRNLDDPSKYKSSEFAIIGVDELTRNTLDTFNFLRFRMRWPGLQEFGLKPQFVAGTNPGEIGHAWVKDYFIDKKLPPELEPLLSEFAYIPATVDDNTYVGADYIRTLDSLPEAMRKAVRHGSWDVFEGQYFTEWDRSQHIIQPFPIPESWRKYRSYDHGRKAPASCGWYAVNEDGEVFKYRELYQSGKNVDELATEIRRLSEGESYAFSVADPAIFANIGYVDRFGGQTIAETFARYGIQFIPGSNRRVDGWNLMHQYLSWDMHKIPKLKFFSTCYNAIRTIPTLVHDDHRPEDVDTQGEDHAADECRYLLMTLHEGRSAKPESELEKQFRKMKESGSVGPDTLNTFYGG